MLRQEFLENAADGLNLLDLLGVHGDFQDLPGDTESRPLRKSRQQGEYQHQGEVERKEVPHPKK